MDKKTKIKKLLSVLKPDETQVDFAEFDKRVNQLKDSLKEKIQLQTLDDVKGQLKNFQKRIDLTPLQNSIKDIETSIDERISQLTEAIEYEIANFDTSLNSQNESSKIALGEITGNIEALRSELKSLNEKKDIELNGIKDKLLSIDELGVNVNASFESIQAELEGLGGSQKIVKTDIESFVNKTNESIEKLRQELSNRINNIRIGGGNQNRNISIGGNSSVLSKYTDINFKAGNNVTLTYANNDTTKNLDITITATGGGSSTVGIIRSINSVSTSQVMGDTAGTDYVYLATAGIKLDLPTGVGNTNQYTIKNISNSSVLVAGTIDDDASGVIMPVKYTSIDVVSNDTDWKIT